MGQFSEPPVNMKLFLIVLLGLAAIAAARPDSVLSLELEDFHHDQDVDDQVVTGTYSYTSPEGVEVFVTYIADEDGFRVVDSNAVPASNGVRADGQQGSFFSSEEHDD